MEAAICPICLGLIRTETPLTDILEFADYPGVTYHSACVERIGVGPTRDILAQNYPDAIVDTGEDVDAPEEPTEEPTEPIAEEPAENVAE